MKHLNVIFRIGLAIFIAIDSVNALANGFILPGLMILLAALITAIPFRTSVQFRFADIINRELEQSIKPYLKNDVICTKFGKKLSIEFEL